MDFKTIGIIFLLIAFIVLIVLFGRKNTSENAENAENSARHFAKLLIAEIKIYEPYKYQRGLKNNSLNESLEIEITDARKKYQKQFSGSEFEIYSDETILNVLANGDKSKLNLISNFENL